MLTFEHSSGAESFGVLNSAEWFVSVAPVSLAVSSSPPSCRSLVVAELGESFSRHEIPLRTAQSEVNGSVGAPVGSGEASGQLPNPELAIVVAGVAAMFIWPRKAKRLLRGIVDGPKLF